MARTFDQVLAEVTARSDPQRNIVLGQISQLPTQQVAEEAGLEAKKTQAFDDITAGARRKGLGFSGIPLGEQAKYTATDYAPAVANLKTSFSNRRGTLESALADIGRQDYTSAQDIYARDRAFEEQQRQFNEQLAEQRRQAASQGNPLSGLFGGGSKAAAPKYTQRSDKGFSFTDAAGRPISAAQYAQATGTSFRSLLDIMARAGDKGAQTALGFVGDDYGYDPRKIGGSVDLYNALVWGTGRNADAAKSVQAVKNAANTKFQPNGPASSILGGR